ncbi:MAG: preprotein translocase subunit SecY [Candidatus Symbiodolus clandestinus]
MKTLGVARPQKHVQDLLYRLLSVFGMLVVFRAGSFIPVPGVNAAVLSSLVEQQRGTIVEMFNMFSGGALRQASIFSLGIMPYISASIVVQLLTVVHPALIELKKEGESGRRKINQYTRYGAFVLALFNAVGITIGLPRIVPGLVVNPTFSFYFVATISLVTGTMLLMWLGEQITEKNVGNGISLIIFTGIVANLPPTIIQTVEKARQGDVSIMLLLIVAIFMLLITSFVVFIEQGNRHITVHHPKQQQGRRESLARNTLLPLKVNMAGVIPAIFASSLILFPATLAKWFSSGTRFQWLFQLSEMLQPGRPLYVMLYASAIIFFSFFYTALVFNPREMANDLKKQGGLILGIRPGEQTARYIDKIMARLTLVGAVYISFICLIPEFFILYKKVPFYFGGTSLLIVVVVIMEFIGQIQTQLMNYQYTSMMKK